MNITYKKSGMHLVIVIDGMISTQDAERFFVECAQLKQEVAQNIIFDFSRVDHVSAHAIYFLSKLIDLLEQEGRELIIFNVDPKIQPIIEELSAIKKIALYDDEQSALTH